MELKRYGWLLFLVVGMVGRVEGQISPPGLGNAKTALWVAGGLRNNLDSAGRVQSMSYVGMGRMSDPDNYNLVGKHAILVLNEEVYHQFHPHWQYSLALSYRWQMEYEDLAPYAAADPASKQEFRVYGRYSYSWKNKRFKVAGTARQELRKFFAPDFEDWEESWQLRSRLRGQLTVNLNKGQGHRLTLSAEALASVGMARGAWGAWGRFGYKESRLGVYYTVKPEGGRLLYSVGYMNNVLGKFGDLKGVHYLSLDVVWENPFGGRRKEKVVPQAGFE